MLPENESKNRIAFWTRIILLLLLYGTRKTNADKTTTLKNTNDDYDILYSNNTLCLNCAFVAANCVVAFDETANMVFGICDDDDDARWRSKKKRGIFEKKKRRFCLG